MSNYEAGGKAAYKEQGLPMPWAELARCNKEYYLEIARAAVEAERGAIEASERKKVLKAVRHTYGENFDCLQQMDRDEFVEEVRARLAQPQKEQPKKRPTIAELEAILNSEEDTPITVNPDGSIGVYPKEQPAVEQRKEFPYDVIDTLQRVIDALEKGAGK